MDKRQFENNGALVRGVKGKLSAPVGFVAIPVPMRSREIAVVNLT